MIFTTYYGRIQSLDPNKYYIFSISNSMPFEVLANIPQLTPDWDRIVKPYKDGKIDNSEYISRYRESLNSKKEEILDIITKLMSSDKDILLCCYETPKKFCHRHIFANWVNEIYGYDFIKEFE